ncbi:lipase family protein [Nocardia jejuensis]|uniref:lipase family protein n=1 Tax=Nocardia jejuensis TaxID=328049 RepID=UPI000831E357|nr:lipase family protein [Nocardia jejuensis]
MAVVAALLTPAAPASAATAPGTLIDALAQADGWREMSGGTVIDYWMTGSQGELERASGALFVPPGSPPPGGWPIIAYDHGTSGLGPGCGGQTGPGAPAVGGLERDWVSRGFAVVLPDYLGLGRFDTGPHPYLEIRTEATATIDLVRAAREANSELSRTWAVFGGSQGGQAALGAGNLQSTYAPELDFRGTIAIDPESDVEKVLPLAGPWVPGISQDVTGLVGMMLTGVRAARPALDVNSYLSPRGRAFVDAIGSLCSNRITPLADGMSIGDLLSRPLTTPEFNTTLTDYMGVPVSGYDAPILLLMNARDTTVPSPLHAALLAQFTANGVDYESVVGLGSHTELSPEMRTAVDAFILRQFSRPTIR